jgi:starch-binding outer membrane protein, SusD/RagB family
MTMKKINIIIVIISLLVVSSCDDFLDKTPTNYGESTTSIKTAADAAVMINGVMSKMCSSSYYGRNMFLYGDAKGGDLTIYSGGRGNDALFVFNHSETSGTYSGFWTLGYNIILQLNNIIANIDKMEKEGSSEDFDNYKGQALTLRAMVYYDLVRLYGKPYNYDKSALGVPDVSEVLDANAQVGRATVEMNYKLIESDLAAGEKLISSDVGGDMNGKINYYGNLALQARVALSKDDFTTALAKAEQIINSKKYSLYSNAEWASSWSKQYASESIFELAMYDNEGDLGSSSLGAYYCRALDYSKSTFAYFGASNQFIARLAEDPQDIRHSVMSYDEKSKSFDKSYATDREGACYKYLGGLSKPGDGKTASSAVNVKIIRLSEIYLIAAEAALRQATPDKTKAAEYLQAIRKRSPNLAPATAANITLDMILNEKSKEFYGEGQRFFDMIRCNKSITFDDETPDAVNLHREHTIDRTFYKCILPIFKDEFNANPAIKGQQNPGYGGTEE